MQCNAMWQLDVLLGTRHIPREVVRDKALHLYKVDAMHREGNAMPL